MQQNRSISLTLALILTTLSLESNSPLAKQATAAPTEAVTAQSKHRIAGDVSGRVEVKRQGASRFVPVSRNTSLRPGDLLRPASGAKVSVLCDDGRTRSVPAGVTTGLNAICPQTRPASNNSSTVKPRAGNPRFPYIISPRATDLLTDKPILRWNAAIDVNRFTVTVRDGDGELNWTKQVSRSEACLESICELAYSGPPLQPGMSYKLVIQTDTNRASDDLGAGDSTGRLGFRLIDAGKAEEVRTIARQIRGQDVPNEVKALALADLYADYNLIAEAIAILEDLAKNQKLAAVYRELGDLYLRIGLAREAEVQYLEAVNLAEESGETEERASAKFGLSEVSLILNRREAAVRLLREAIAGYEQLGDTERVKALEARLGRLTNEGEG